MLDLIAWQIEQRPEILKRGEATDLLSRRGNARGHLLVEPGQRCDHCDRGMVDVDEPTVIRAGKVGPTHASLKCQLRILMRESESLLALCQAFASSVQARVAWMNETREMIVQPSHHLGPGLLSDGDVVLDA